MTTKPGDEPAFSNTIRAFDEFSDLRGMSKREYYAAHGPFRWAANQDSMSVEDAHYLAKRNVEYADFLIAELQKEEKK